MSLPSEILELEDEELAEWVALNKKADYQLDPVLWLEEELGEHFWSKQREIAYSVRDNRFTAVKACHGPGKSYSAARIICWWLSTHKPGDAFVVSTAPTFAQVQAILWREINKAHRKGNLVGRVNQTSWWIENEIVGFGRKPSDYDPSAFQGIHAPAVLVAIDEAAGVPKELWDAAETLVTNDESRILAIGNPDDPQSYFSEICKPGRGWNVITISAFDTPNFTDEEVPPEVAKQLTSVQWVEERKERWGEHSALYVSKVLGEFPEDTEDGVIPLSWIRRCRAEPSGELVSLGLDVGASVGGDETVIRAMIGNKPGGEWAMRTGEPEEIVGKAVRVINETGAKEIKVDVIGVGFGIAGWLETLAKEKKHSARVVRVNVAKKSSDKRFPNLRSQLWWNMREMIEQGHLDLSELDEETIGELISPKYSINATGQIVVEPKDKTKERIGRSPDHADAFLLANHFRPVAKASTVAGTRL